MKQADIMTLLEEAERIGARIQDKTEAGAPREPQGRESVAQQPPAPVAERMEMQAPPLSTPVPQTAQPQYPSEVAQVAEPQAPMPVQQPDIAAHQDVETRAGVAAQAAAAAVQQVAPQHNAPMNSEMQAQQAMAGAPTGTSAQAWHEEVPIGYGAVVSKGLVFVFGFLLAFAAWASFLPIDSAVVAAGKIISSGQNKLVQHPSGGVVRDILIADGDQVKEGDLLLTIDKSTAQAELSRLLARKTLLEAQRTRYLSEQAGRDPNLQGSAAVLRGGQSIVEGRASDDQSLVAEQRREFAAGRARLTAQLEAIEFQIETLKDQKEGLQARIAGGRKLLEINTLELAKVRPLVTDGYLPKSRLWDLEKVRLEQVTAIENFESEIAASDQRISEAKANLAGLEQQDRETNAEELTRVVGELAEIKEPIMAARMALESTEMRAPVSGTIVNLTANTKGGVVSPGGTVAEIVPGNAKLEVEFRVPLEKAKHVYPGQKMRVVITTFNRRTYDPIDGEVTFVSADSLIDEQTGETYFLSRAKLIPNSEKNTGIKEITPGMATEVYVLAEPRVFASYLFQPIVDSFNRAFREI